MKSKYDVLLKILDDICASAPSHLITYKPFVSNEDQKIAARARALLHLYLMVECGCNEDDFLSREALICDGSMDGGLDAYFVDDKRKQIFLIQSKFRANADNFQDTSIKADEIIKTDFDRITQGYSTDSKGVKFNAEVLKFQRRLQKINNIAKYKITAILIANLNQYSPNQVKRLVGHHPYEIFDSDKVYDRLVFPICQGTYFNPSEISIQVPLTKNEAPRLKQTIRTSAGDCDVTVIYVPAIEVGKMLLQYKNAILAHNPRNYLALKESTESVNAQIAASITRLTANDFALLNNGITMLTENSSITDHSGKKNVGILTVVNPQIINGGQTAYTLSQIYADTANPTKIFKGKEVMLKIITLQVHGKPREKFIDMISNATNQQNPVKEADRRSNNPVLTELQASIFREYGFFFERKRGEFFNGSRKGYMAGQHIINRAELIRAWVSYSGDPSSGRRSETSLFDKGQLDAVLPDAGNYRQVFFAYVLLQEYKKIQKAFKKGITNYLGCDNAFSYGQFAIISAAAKYASQVKEGISVLDLEKIAANLLDRVLKKWKDFEDFARSKQPDNLKYFDGKAENFDNYYKGKTIRKNIEEFFV